MYHELISAAEAATGEPSSEGYRLMGKYVVAHEYDRGMSHPSEKPDQEPVNGSLNWVIPGKQDPSRLEPIDIARRH